MGLWNVFDYRVKTEVLSEATLRLTHGYFKPEKKLSSRLQCLINGDFRCVVCGVVGTHIYVWKSPKDPGIHIDVVARTDGGGCYLMTADHIWPRSKGGRDNITNYQVMCHKCNSRKGNLMDDRTPVPQMPICGHRLGFTSEKRAKREAFRMHYSGSTILSVFPCPLCFRFHIGDDRTLLKVEAYKDGLVRAS